MCKITPKNSEKRPLMLGVDLQSQDTLLKYIGGLDKYLRHTMLMFNPNNLDDVCAQATHLEARGKNTPEEGSKKPFKSKGKEKDFKGKAKKMHLSKREGKLHANIILERVTMKLMLEASSKNETKEKQKKGQQKTTATTQ